jgi:methanogenic corrinoid protein MtbC1
MTTIAVREQRAIINTLKQAGLRDKLRIMVGGGAVT